MSSTGSQALINSYGAMTTVSYFLTPLERVKLQALCKRFYEHLIPQVVTLVETPNVSLILESSRKDIQIGTWRKNAKVCKVQRLLKIGKGEGEDDPDKLGFSEIYFQWLIQLDKYNFLAFPIENEALLKQGYRLKFGSDYKLKESKPIAAMNENAMRPSAVLWRHKDARLGPKLMMIGGRADRHC